MGLFGVDVSNHQTSFNFTGWDFAFLKASEGSTFKDRMFHTHLANARKAGAVVAAYHYQRTNPAEEQVANIESMVPKDVPVIIDVEDGSGSPELTREIIRGLRERGYRIGPLYLPRWYWQKIGKPSLHDLPRLWASWYPDYVSRPREEGIAEVPTSAWEPYGGNQVAVMQFTSTPFDQNWFAGTKAQLLSLLESAPPSSGGGAAPVNKTPKGDEVMFIRNLDTGETAILSGGVLTGTDSANAEATNREGGGGQLHGVDQPVWDDLVNKSRNIEELNVRLTLVVDTLERIAAALESTPEDIK
jgi:hypothetical protein